MYQNALPFQGLVTFHCMDKAWLVIHSSESGRLVCCHLLATVSTSAVNTKVYISESLLSIFLGTYSEVELPNHMVTLFEFLRNCQTVSHSTSTIFYPVPRPHTVCKDSDQRLPL